MRQELPSVELLETSSHLLPEPYIVIQIVLHELLDVFVRTSLDVGGDAVKLGLQFGGEVHFHNLRVAYILTQNEDTDF
jgi:hypothetical protein